MAGDKTIVHITHEAAGKIGGIGAVLEGLLTSRTYVQHVDRSILIGPLFDLAGLKADSFSENIEIEYCRREGLSTTQYAPAFRQIEKDFNAEIIYGKRKFQNCQSGICGWAQIILIDVRHINKEIVNRFKWELFRHFGIRSDLYEHIWEYEEYVRLAPAAIAALEAIGALNDAIIIAHEFMGMPTALAAKLAGSSALQTVFYAHEVATIRNIVENECGHDTMFYNTLKYCKENNFFINEVFGNQSDYFKHPLVEASKYCDYICVVGDYVGEELRFLAPQFAGANISVVYNGIPAYRITAEQKLLSKAKLQKYCENLLGYKPDFVFTHVTRLVKSKGLWRDLQVLLNLEKKFCTDGKTAVFFLLSTETSKRPGNMVFEMESKYDWPAAHREGWPDLSGGEARLYTLIQKFNAQSRNIKVVFINQFGFCRECCGIRVPADLKFDDIRIGTDAEFGMSIYEPFGISQLEALTFGGICVISSVCGCAGFLQDAANGQKNQNVIIGDYIDLHRCGFNSFEKLVQIDDTILDMIEYCQAQRLANSLFQKLTTDYDLEKLIQNGYDIAKNMSWDVVVQNYLLPALQKSPNKKTLTKSFTGV